MKEILQTKVINSLITLKVCEPCCYLDAYSLSFVVNILAYHVDYNLMPPSTKKSHLGDNCDRTTSKMRGFVSQDHIGGFSTKRECANTHK
jgi:hypothetical protein